MRAQGTGERRIRYPWVWLAFVVILLAAAALLLSPEPQRQALGILLLLSPLVAFTTAMALYYWRSRRIEDGAARSDDAGAGRGRLEGDKDTAPAAGDQDAGPRR